MPWTILSIVSAFRQFPFPLPRPEPLPQSHFESWFQLFMAFWIFFGLVLLVLPRNWSNAVVRAAFPFLPKRLR